MKKDYCKNCKHCCLKAIQFSYVQYCLKHKDFTQYINNCNLFFKNEYIETVLLF